MLIGAVAYWCVTYSVYDMIVSTGFMNSHKLIALSVLLFFMVFIGIYITALLFVSISIILGEKYA